MDTIKHENVLIYLSDLIVIHNSTKNRRDHGGSDSTVIKRRQQQLGRMADFLSSVTLSVFYL